ncbi:MAG: hypothetical protein ABIH41_05435 [Nanoarchaeota archaeon]
MVRINQQAFNEEMGSYISKRRGKSSLAKRITMGWSRPSFPGSEDVTVFEERSSVPLFSRVFGRRSRSEMVQDVQRASEPMEVDSMDAGDDVDERPEEGPGFFAKIMALFGSSAEDADEDMVIPSNPQIPEDVQEVLKITFRWIEKLPKYRLAEFKSSQDFEMYKDTLLKYGVVRKKE